MSSFLYSAFSFFVCFVIFKPLVVFVKVFQFVHDHCCSPLTVSRITMFSSIMIVYLPMFADCANNFSITVTQVSAC